MPSRRRSPHPQGSRRTSRPARPRSISAWPATRAAKGAKNKVGPELNGLDGRHSGTAPGYSYSDANKNSGITWNEAQFKDYIKDPKAKIPGTKMVFAGIKNEKEATSGRFSRNTTRTERPGKAPLDASLANQRSSILRHTERRSFGIIDRDAGSTSWD